MKKNKFAVFDIEAENWVNFRKAGLYDGDRYYLFNSLEDFCNKLFSREYRGYKLYAHFGGRYDFLFLLPYLVTQKEWNFKIFDTRGSRISSISLRNGKNYIHLCDSFSLMPMSLKDLGEAFNTTHKKLDLDISNYKKYSNEEIERYLYNDVLCLYEVIEAFQNWGLNGGKLSKKTLASQSLYIFRNRFKQKVRFYTLPEGEENFIRKGYFGGRTEIFKQYGKGLNYYDINSLYPFAMLGKMPCGNFLYTKRQIKDTIGFYKIFASIPKMPITPLGKIVDGKYIFGYGESYFYVTSDDLILLDKLNIKYEIKEGIAFQFALPIFDDYIKKMYEIKQNSKKASIDYIISKLYMNALYGKFGQKREQEEIIYFTDDNVELKGLIPYMEEFGLYKRKILSKSKFILPYLSSYITSKARNILYNYFLKCGVDNVYYCDTDSIITSSKLKCSDTLGGMKEEYTGIKEAVFIQPKVYSLRLKDRDICKVKGFKLDGLKFNDYLKVLNSGDLSTFKYKQNRVMGYKENLRRFKSINPRFIEFNKKLSANYNKRLIINNSLTEALIYG